MQTSAWGSNYWLSLHTTSFNYPVNPDEYDSKNEEPIGSTRQKYKQFFISVGETLPCKYCRISYREFIKENPIRLDSRDDLTLWLYEIHNMVNNKLGKNSIPFEQVKEKYEGFRADCSAKVAKGCVKPFNKRMPVKCYIIHSRCPSFVVYFFTSLLLMVLMRIIFKKGNLYNLLK